MALFPRKIKPSLVAVPDYSAATELTPPTFSKAAGSKTYTITITGWYAWVPNLNVSYESWGVWWYVNSKLVAATRVGNDGGHTDSKIFPVTAGDVLKVQWPKANKAVANGSCKMYLFPIKYVLN